MTEKAGAGRPGGDSSPNAPAPEPNRGLVLAIAAALIVLFAFTASLSRGYHEQRDERGKENFRVGQALAAAARPQEAAQHFRTALAYDRDNIDYRLALALALMEMERFTEAESRMKEVLARDPTNGLANRRMARLLARQDRSREAFDYYKRAIYGLWTDDAASNRLATRIELIEILARNGPSKLLLPELLELQAETPTEPAIRRRLAEYFIHAEAPDHAARILRDLVATGTKERGLLTLLGVAEYQTANYDAAAVALQQALRNDKEDPQARDVLAKVNVILSLDPTSRRVSVRERFRRSRTVLAETVLLFEKCSGARKPGTDQVLLLESGHKHLAAEVLAAERAEATDSNIQLSLALWSEKGKLCGPPPSDEEALARLMEKLAR